MTANFPGHFPGSRDTGVKLPDIPGQALFRESENPNPNPNPNLKPYPNPNPNPNLIPNPKSEPESIKNNYYLVKIIIPGVKLLPLSKNASPCKAGY